VLKPPIGGGGGGGGGSEDVDGSGGGGGGLGGMFDPRADFDVSELTREALAASD
jgi:hypothetical protein